MRARKTKAYDELGERSSRRNLELKPGMCFSSEPRLYKPIGKGTFIQTAMEEVLIVTDTGREVITSAPFMDELLD